MAAGLSVGPGEAGAGVPAPVPSRKPVSAAELCSQSRRSSAPFLPRVQLCCSRPRSPAGSPTCPPAQPPGQPPGWARSSQIRPGAGETFQPAQPPPADSTVLLPSSSFRASLLEDGRSGRLKSSASINALENKARQKPEVGSEIPHFDRKGTLLSPLLLFLLTEPNLEEPRLRHAAGPSGHVGVVLCR